ncbi:MFS-type transporter SLC18B1 [Amphibalanus amphitrite]|uniref:MFS-type transporter SLC18B1 n=1 Tax=Amphibalanus amphitrite TaxID=1232801 RepID=A0A6A4VBQ1_AMPAM|nr:MFS-type transporter SLC18B1 [Amphibalanus amphitrite]
MQPGLTEPAAPLTRRERRLLGCLALVGLLSGSLLVVMIPFFPVEAAARGLSQTTITGVTTVVFGALRHIVDPRLFAAACLAVRLVEAAGTAAVSGCALTIIASQFPTRTSRAIALVTASQAVGMAAAPAIGSGLFALGGFSLPFYVTGAALLLVAAVNHWLMPVVERCSRPAVPYLSLWRVFAKCPENWLCLLTVFHYSLVLLTFDTSVAPYADRTLGVTPSTLGLYFTVATTAFALTAFVWARVAETSRRPHAFIGLGLLVVSASLLLAPPSPLLVGLQPHWWLLGLGMTLMEAFFGGAYIPSFQLMLAAGVGAGLADDLISQAFVSGVLWTAHSLGSVVGPPLGGLVVDQYGFPVMMTGLSALVLVVAVMNLCYAGWVACRPAPANPSESNSAGERIQSKA